MLPNFLYSFSFSSAMAEVMSFFSFSSAHLGAHLGNLRLQHRLGVVVVHGDEGLAHAETHGVLVGDDQLVARLVQVLHHLLLLAKGSGCMGKVQQGEQIGKSQSFAGGIKLFWWEPPTVGYWVPQRTDLALSSALTSCRRVLRRPKAQMFC